jgi:hypothetical protein
VYSDTELRAAVVEVSSRAPPVELGPVIARLPGLERDGRFEVSWA